MTNEKQTGWGIYPYQGVNHVLPVDESDRHAFHNCPCGADYADDFSCIVHNSFDGREAFERGERKVS